MYCIFLIIVTVKTFITKKFIQKSLFIEYNNYRKKQENYKENGTRI